MPTQQKVDRVSDLADKLKRSTITLTADYTGISVNEMNELRRQMRANGVEFTIIKNTLMNLAAEAEFDGPYSLIFDSAGSEWDSLAEIQEVVTSYI